MCGFAGTLYFDGQRPKTDTLRRMTDQIKHRGPDDCGLFSDDRIGLGFRLLSTHVGEGEQPICNEDQSIWVVCNGTIDNYRELRRELEACGHRFKTSTEAEVLAHLYEQYGASSVERLRGMFGFALWDSKAGSLLAARDPFGIKPFYYVANRGRLLFSSEIKSLLAADGVEPQIQTESLLNFLTFQYVPEPNTMFRNIIKLPPGHLLRVKSTGQLDLERYWHPRFEPEERPIDSFIEEIRAMMQSTVDGHMQADVECGSFLSSGIDSTAIAAMMRRRRPIKTFTVGFEGANNETVIAEKTARALGTTHYSHIITEQEYFDSIPAAVWYMDEPIADPSAIALYHVAKLAREHVPMVMSGEGADELFGGYRIYREPMALRPLTWLPLPLKRILNRTVSRLPDFQGKNYVLRGTTPLEERFLGNAKIFTEGLKGEVLYHAAEMLGNYAGPTEIAGQYYRDSKHLDPVTRMQLIDIHLWLPGNILMKADKMTMAHSLELRVPFLDQRVFELASRIPPSYLLARGTTKYVLRKAMEGIVPDFIRDRPKLGFPVPIRDWIRGSRGDEMIERIDGSGIDSIFRMDGIRDLLRRHRAGTADYSRNLWTVYLFAEWHRVFIKERALVQDIVHGA